ncbi:hypothetical protein FOMPIDRAFT_1121318 [Fomitopsis schrenkii]|uniref:Transcription factor IIIC putative zinc-finger domain-containing protein n=1 Tax=Fomitopsis schrenkii TaxID=2126942 RepID=S8ECL2_FOMSC|nr:hypothetical protein FOMPIDRAFT_1121318 [Fomitopsis schrenkii]
MVTALSLPGVSAAPSAKCLQWTADGQLLVLTKSAVHILTPNVAISREMTSNAGHIEEPEQDLDSGDVRRVEWLRTMITLEKTLAYQWPTDSKDWGAVALGSLDPGFRAVTSSPSNLTGDASCLLVVLNSNMELTLWGPVKNLLTGEWSRLMDLTAFLRAHFTAASDDPALESVLRAQSTCIGWSSQADFGLAPTPLFDRSLLAVGNRAGSVTFLRFCGKKDGTWEVECAATVPVADRWVTHVAWSSWKRPQSGTCEAYIACGIADGSVVVLRVTQTLHSQPSPSGFVPRYNVRATFDVRDVKPAEAGWGEVTSMKWTTPSADVDTLVYSKPGKLYVWALASNGHSPIFRTIALHTQHVSVGSSALTPVVGLEYVTSEDTLVVALTDGSFHTVLHFSGTRTTAEPPAEPGLSGLRLSKTARATFAAAEPENTTTRDVNRHYGMVSYDGFSWFAWLHESCRPTDFSYKHDARHTCMLVVAKLWDAEWKTCLLADLRTSIAAASAESPLACLRPALLHLQDPKSLASICGRLLGLLKQDPALSDAPPPSFSSSVDDATAEFRPDYVQSLGAHLLGSAALYSLRKRLLIASVCARTAELDHDRQAFANVATSCQSRIESRVQTAILRYILLALPALTDADKPFAMRMVARACLPGSDPDVVRDAHALAAKLGSTATSEGAPNQYEPCPACQAPIPFHNAAAAECPHGHVWARCSVTSYIIATPLVRACVSCNCKAFIPTQQPADPLISGNVRDSWLAADTLTAARRCLRCGNNFVMLL